MPETWKLWLNDLHNLSNISLPRCLRPRGFGDAVSYQLHHFSDGSERAYGTVSYLRVVNKAGIIYCGFVFGRSRLATNEGDDHSKTGIGGGHVSCQMDAMLRSAFRTEIDSWFWTDSTTVLRYIRNEKTRFHTFVANRLAVIREGTSPKQWRYVNGSLNPADIASRGARGIDLIKNKGWFSGPNFLGKKNMNGPLIPNNLGDVSEDKEVKRAHEHDQSMIVDFGGKLCEYYFYSGCTSYSKVSELF